MYKCCEFALQCNITRASFLLKSLKAGFAQQVGKAAKALDGRVAALLLGAAQVGGV